MYYPVNSERTIIKADPNWFVAWPSREGVILSPVIAWLIVHGARAYRHSVAASVDEKLVSASPYPITVDGVQDNEHSCLKDPDGRFLAFEQAWENEADLLARWPFEATQIEAV